MSLDSITMFAPRQKTLGLAAGHTRPQPTPSPKCLMLIRIAEVGVEPTRPCGQGILSPQRLPFRHSAHRTTVCLPEAYVCILQGVRRQAGRLAGPDCPGQSRSLSTTLLSRKTRGSFERLTSRTGILWKLPPNARHFLNRDYRSVPKCPPGDHKKTAHDYRPTAMGSPHLSN